MFDRTRAKLQVALAEAKTKVTTYVGLLIAAAPEARDNWSQLDEFVKGHHWAEWTSNHIYAALGLLVIYTRIRRFLKDK